MKKDTRVFKPIARATIYLESFEVDGQMMMIASDGKNLLTWDQVEFIFRGLKDAEDYANGQKLLFNGDTLTEGGNG